MIREIKRCKSVKDYITNDLHFDVSSFWISNDNNDYDNEFDKLNVIDSFWIAAICPFCGQKQYVRWDWHDKLRYKLNKFLDESYGIDGAQVLIWNSIMHDVDDFLKNDFKCVSCGKDLSYKPGYYFSSSKDLRFKRYHKETYFVENAFIPFGYKHREWVAESTNTRDNYADSLYFDCYEDTLGYKRYAEISKKIALRGVEYYGTRNDDSVYDDNSISKSYINRFVDKSAVTESAIGLYATIDYVDDRDLYADATVSIEQIFGLMEYYQNYDEMYEDEVSNLIRIETESIENSVEVESVQKELSLDQIKDILKEMIGIETLIISMHGRLKRLSLVKERENSKYLNITTDNEKTRIVQLENEINELTQKRSSLETDTPNINIFIEKIAKDKPKISYPIEPNRPIEPQYETPGLFNKKKVEAANSEKKQKYDADLASYNVALSEYNRLLSDAQKMEKEQNEEIRQEAMILAQEYRKKELSDIESKISECQFGIESAKSEISQKEIEIQAVKDNLSELPWNKEYDQAVDLLKKTLEAKIVYEKSEVIFPKYQNLVAYSQFYEYFQSGRCTSLTGPDGAYNLYETELRQNIIIGKLDDITNSLEEIKQNQFMIYSELKSINSNISKLDDSMNKILGKVTEIGTNVEAIRNSTEIMEENSKIAAYYSKKNAELTNAMGYLVALK